MDAEVTMIVSQNLRHNMWLWTSKLLIARSNSESLKLEVECISPSTG